ncbi:TPA: ATP-grasp domain-containing protein [Serratia fonticola]|uniref:ATP-grasp domain-containing protein n=1 Tax=Serratia fonticola TaxID=47917 RepID=UPI00217A3B3E|nr:hypothetical protein [Serratia fonticola]CAI1052005.1 Glutathione synthase/Ribosomal protein S6 modification enzyme (glutaminyl transferase) [Serratia fonticola]
MEKKFLLGICCYPGHELDKMIAACDENNVNYKVIDFLSHDWLNSCTDDIDGYLIRPTCRYQEHKSIFDERAYFINKLLKKPTYPSFDELYSYENKRNMHLFLMGVNAPHPKTFVFMDKKNANYFLENTNYPIVMKSNIGSAGVSVKVIKKYSEAKGYLRKIFGSFYSDLSFGWNPVIPFKGVPIPRVGRSQKHYAIFQEFLPIKWEWRMIRIGDSYFGHQKLIGDNGFASGSELVGWATPPNELLNLLHETTTNMNTRCMVLDIFETHSGEYYINEIQSIIGAYRPYQMKVDGKPGRFTRNRNGEFIFEEGIHCANSCWNLRVNDFLSMLNKV